MTTDDFRAAMERGEQAAQMVTVACEITCLVRDKETDGIPDLLARMSPAELLTLVITQAAMIPVDRSPAELLSWVLWDEHGVPLPVPVYEHPQPAWSVTGGRWHQFQFHPVRDPRTLRPCGTYAAYARHVDHEEPIDDACEMAARRYWAERKRTRRENAAAAVRAEAAADAA